MAEVMAAIDVGSYEIAMKIFELSARKGVRELDHVRFRLDLGSESYATGRISAARISEICRILTEFKRVMKTWGADKVRVCGTSALRESRNASVALEQIEKRTGFTIEILSNSEQRFLDYKAIALKSAVFEKMIEAPTAIVDIGGGSVQISLFDRDKLITTQNLRMGVLRLRERVNQMGIGTARYNTLVCELIQAQLSVFARMYLRDKDNISNMIIVDDYISPILQKKKTLDEIGLLSDASRSASGGMVDAENFIRFLAAVPTESQIRNADRLGIPLENLPLVYISGLIIKCIAEMMHTVTIWAPGVTLCDGITYEYAEKHRILEVRHDFEQDIIASAYHISQRYKGNRKRSELIGNLALGVFDSMKKIHGLGKRDRLLLQIAAILHDCGKYVSMMNIGESAYAIIMSTEIIGLSHRERQIVAWVVHNIYSAIPDVEDGTRDNGLIDESLRLRVLKLTAMLRVAGGLDRSHLKKFKGAGFKLCDNQLVITANTEEDITLEKSLFGRRATFFEEIFGVVPVVRKKTDTVRGQ
ncbi:MAG: exopolyphosphatase [Lachnospiraceae bacterium]|nr:exopolyphosphatase [Lachnospiraceae bacterium]